MRLQELPLVQHPCLKRHSTVAPDRQHALRIQNGPFEVSLDLPRPAREELVIALTAAAPPGAFLPALARLFDLTPAECDGLVSQLVRAGLIIEHPDSRPATLRGDYLGWRLIDVYRTTAPSIWGKSPLFDALRTPGNRTVAIGALLEAYYRLRAAAPSAAAVLGRTLTPRQRELYENFIIEERGHAEDILPAFADLGLDPERVRATPAAPETELLMRFFSSTAHASAAEFAAALVVPEVGEVPAGAVHDHAPYDAMMDLVERVQGLPTVVGARFRAHDVVNDALDHGNLPVTILEEESSFTRAAAERLMATLHYTIEAYQVHFNGIVRRYRESAERELLAPIGGEL